MALISKSPVLYPRLYQLYNRMNTHNEILTSSLRRMFHLNYRSSNDGESTQSSYPDDDYADSPGPDSMYDQLYPGHIQTNTLQKTLLTVGSALASLYNPRRDDMIATLGEASGYWALKSIKSEMEQDEEGLQILRERPEINTKTLDMDYLQNLSEDTFGYTYSQFLHKNGFSPDARRAVAFVDDVDLAYVMLRYRQIHDLIHTLIGMPPNMQGEVSVKWLEAFHTGLPLCVLGGIFGPLRFTAKQQKDYISTYLPWTLKNGLQVKRNLMCIYYEHYWDWSISDLRSEIGLSPPPSR